MSADRSVFDWKSEVCHDCGAKVGELHMEGCDMERCPVCRRQLISCSEEHNELAGSSEYARIPYIQPLIICAVCGEVFPDGFSVPDLDWDKYVPSNLQGDTLCRPCYDYMRDVLFPNGWRMATRRIVIRRNSG